MNRRGRPKHPGILTPREQEVLDLIRDGLTNDEIARRLGISVGGVKFHVTEILSKLHLTTREQAARWRPDDDRPSSLGALAPIATLRMKLGSLFPAAAGVAALACVVGIAVAASAVIAALPDKDAAAQWTVDAPDTTTPSVLIFDFNARGVRYVAPAKNIILADWVADGDNFVAYDRLAYRYDLITATGTHVRSFEQLNIPPRLYKMMRPAHDGRRVAVEDAMNRHVDLLDVETGNSVRVNDSAVQPWFSPDGQQLASVWVNGYDKEGVTHDWSSVMVAPRQPPFTTETPQPDFRLGGAVSWGQREADGYLGLAPDPWSPDGRYLLVQQVWQYPAGEPPCAGAREFAVYALVPTGSVVWHRPEYACGLSFAQWAGPGKLFLSFSPDAPRDPDYPDARALFVDLGLEKRPTPDLLADSCCVSFSPDGRYAIARIGDGDWRDQRCSVIAVDTGDQVASAPAKFGDSAAVFCAHVSWTDDGSQALVSDAMP